MSKSKEQIDSEITELAENMVKSVTDSKQLLFDTIMNLGPENLKKAINNLSESDKDLLKSCISDMQKAKEISEEITPKKTETKASDMKTESQTGSDDEDEKKLMNEKNAQHPHQGGSKDKPEGWEGQIIKGENGKEKEEPEVEMPAKEAVKEHKRLVGVLESESHEDDKEEAKKQKKELKEYQSEMKKGLDDKQVIGEGSKGGKIVGHTSKGKVIYESQLKAALKAHNSGKEDPSANENYNEAKGLGDMTHRGVVSGAARSKHGIGGENKKVSIEDVNSHIMSNHKWGNLEKADSKAIDKLVEVEEAEHNKDLNEDGKIAEKLEKECKMKKSLVEIVELAKSLKLSKEEVVKAIKDANEDLELVKGKMKEKFAKQGMKLNEPPKEEKKEVEDSPEDKKEDKKEKKIEKSINWNFKSSIAANTLGRNTHWDVDSYIEKSEQDKQEIIKKGGYFGEVQGESLQKSDVKKVDINDLIEKGMDFSTDEIKRIEGIRDHKIEGKIVKSFLDEDIAAALGMTKEEYIKLMGS